MKPLASRHWLEGTVSRDFFLQGFFHESSSPKPLKITLGSLWISSNIRLSRFHHWWQIFHWYQQKVNLKKRNIFMLTHYSKVSKQMFKTFLIDDFFHLSPVSATPVVHLELRISPWILEKKIWNDPNGILRGLGEIDSWKKPEVENLVALSL